MRNDNPHYEIGWQNDDFIIGKITIIRRWGNMAESRKVDADTWNQVLKRKKYERDKKHAKRIQDFINELFRKNHVS